MNNANARRLLVAFTLCLTWPALGQDFFRQSLPGIAEENRHASKFADMNGDGLPDLVYIFNRVGIQHRSFRRTRVSFDRVTYLLENLGAYRALEVADFNGDGRPDIATGGSSSNIVILWNAIDLMEPYTRTVIDAERGTHSLQAVDIDRDGTLDLLSAGRFNSGVVWYSVSPEGAEAHPVDREFTAPFAAMAGNLDEDEDLEMVVSTETGYEVLDWAPTQEAPEGAFVFASPLMEEAADGRRLILEDLDRDGKLDIATAIREQGEAPQTKVVWFRNEGGLVFSPHELASEMSSSSSYYRWIEAVDVDGDFDPDLVASKWSAATGEFRIWLNDGAGTFTEHVLSYPDVGRSMHGFTTLRLFEDGRHAIFPGRVDTALTAWPAIAIVPEQPQLKVVFLNGKVRLFWPAAPGYRYQVQFSDDLEGWVNSYRSGGATVEVLPQTDRTGPSQALILEAPDSAKLFVRLVREKVPQ